MSVQGGEEVLVGAALPLAGLRGGGGGGPVAAGVIVVVGCQVGEAGHQDVDSVLLQVFQEINECGWIKSQNNATM